MAMKKVKLNEEQISRADYIEEFYGKSKGLNRNACEQIAVITDEMFAEAVKDGDVQPNDNPDDFIESAIMDFKAGKNRVYIKSETKERKKVERVRKVDTEKGRLLGICKTALESDGIVITSEKTETEISFSVDGVEYTLKLTKHRPKKA